MQSIATGFVSIACSDSIHEFGCNVVRSGVVSYLSPSCRLIDGIEAIDEAAIAGQGGDEEARDPVPGGQPAGHASAVARQGGTLGPRRAETERLSRSVRLRDPVGSRAARSAPGGP